MTYFIIKEVVLFLGTPFTLSLFLLSLALILIRSGRMRRLAQGLLVIAVVQLFLFSLPVVSMSLIGTLEKRYDAAPGDDLSNPEWSAVKYIVILGGSSSSDTSLPIISRQNTAQLKRVLEGMRIYHRRPGTKLIVTGASMRRDSEAAVMRQLLEALGVAREDIIEEPQALNTAEHVRYVRQLIGDEKFFLVTSAIHMPRAVAHFRKGGLNSIPHSADRYYRKLGFYAGFKPRAESLWHSEMALYEYYGLLRAKLTGLI